MPKISDASKVEIGKNYVKVDDQKIGKWWGKTLYYIDSDQNLRYRNFSLPGRILQCFGYKSKYNSQNLDTWLKSKKIVQSGSTSVDETKKIQLDTLCSKFNLHAEEIIQLFDDGLDVNAILDKNNTTPLHVASKHGCTNLVNYLLSKGADADAKLTEPGALAVTALQLAVLTCDHNLVDILAEWSTKGAEKNSFGDAALHIAVNSVEKPSDNIFIIQILMLSFPEHVNATNALGQTALHLACMKGDLEAVKFLYRRGAILANIDPSIKDKNGETAYDIAVSNGFNEIEGYLKKS